MPAPSARSKWDVLVETGAGTPMGQLLRRYWWPIAGASELPPGAVRPVRLLGGDFALFRTGHGDLGLIERACAHRRADLCHGFVEAEGIRCSYHGWLYGRTGECLQRPFDAVVCGPRTAPDSARISAYLAQAHGGIIWAYLGPEPAPLVPDWEFFSWRNGFVQVVISEVPCNWFQCQENSIDPVHFEWQHGNWSVRSTGGGAYQPTHTKIDFEEFEYGFIYRRIREDTSEEHPLWKTGRVCLWPAALFTGNHIEFRVPIDDENTLSVTWSFSRVPQEQEPYEQSEIPTWRAPVFDQQGNIITSHLTNQDFLAWLGQGRIADRSREHLGASDRGIVMMRSKFLDDLAAIAEGKDPKATVRDPFVNKAIPLPVAERNFLMSGAPLRVMLADPDKRARLRGYIFQAGQPATVRRAYEEAMGVRGLEIAIDESAADILALKLT